MYQKNSSSSMDLKNDQKNYKIKILYKKKLHIVKPSNMYVKRVKSPKPVRGNMIGRIDRG